MIKLSVARKFVAILANTSLLFNSFVPFLLAAKPAYAQEVIIPEIVVPTLAPEPTAIPTEEPTITPIEPTPTPEPTITPEPTPTVDPINVEIGVLTPPVGEITPSPEPSIEISVNPELTPTPENIITPEATPTETPVFEKVCLTDEQIKDITNEEWVIDDVNGISETKGKVQLGVRYVYPQENKVSVTFKCLPKDESLRTSLKIEKVKTADLNLPDAIDSVGEYAYDITTGMKDGDFEYDLTLPKPENSTAEISYIAKSIDEAKSNLTFFDINKIEDSKTEQSLDTVKAVSIDHFTIYLITILETDFPYSCTGQCVSEDVKVQIIALVDSLGNPLVCGIDDTTKNSYLKINYTSTASNRYSVYIQGQLLINGLDSGFINSFNTCSDKVSGSQEIIYHIGDVNCGSSLSIRDLKLNWSNNTLQDETQNCENLFNTTHDCSSPKCYASSSDYTISTPPSLKLVKEFGSLWGISSDWTLTASGSSILSGNPPQSDPTINYIRGVVLPGNYILSENGPSGYTSSNWSCVVNNNEPIVGNSITLSNNDNAVCTIVNTRDPFCGDGNIDSNNGEQCDDGNNIDGDGCNSTCQWENATLLVKKHVVNDNGGLKNASDFTLNIGGTLFSGSENGTLFTLPAGSYSVGETLLPGYAQTSNECSNINLVAGESQTCTITNNDQAPTLTLIKSWSDVYNSGYTINDWTLSAAGIGSTLILTGQGSVTGNVLADTYTLSESGPTGTSSSVWDCTGGATLNGNLLTVSLGQNITCTITNTPIQPKLTVTKIVVNDNGGSKVVADFPLYVDSVQVTSGIKNGFNVGTYIISETNQPGYSSTISGDCDPKTGSITLALGDDKSCTITNDDITASLKLVKEVINDNGGNATASSFRLEANNTTFTSGVAQNVDAGTYTLAETGGPTGYTASDWSCVGGTQNGSNITLIEGQSATCTITNNDIAPKLTLIKNVINNNGGNAQPDDFKLTVGEVGVSSGAKNTYFANTAYTINETQLAGYKFVSIIGDTKCPTALGNTITLSPGDDITCTITNEDISPSITLIKDVINNNGGTAGVNDFGLSIDGTLVNSNQKYSVKSNIPYALNETGLTGYSFVSISGAGCPANLGDTVTLSEGQDITCTIINDDQQAYIIVDKTVVNDNGGSAKPDDFKLTVDNDAVLDEIAYAVTPGEHTVGETNLSGYIAGAWGMDCSSDGKVTVKLGETKKCTITNDDQQSYIIVNKTVINNNGGTAEPNDFKLTVDGDAVSDEVAYAVNPGSHLVSETNLLGYSAGNWGGDCDTQGSVVVNLGQTKTCTITNDDQAPTLTLIKSWTDTYNSGYTPSNWTLSAIGTGSSLVGNGSITGNVLADTYTLSESGPVGTNSSVWDCTGGATLNGDVLTISLGQNITCTITNTPIQPKLTIIKQVIGSTEPISNFSLFVDSTPVISGVQNGFNVGTYTVSETPNPNYSISFSGDCNSNGSVSLTLGDNKTCTIINTRNTGTLIAHKFEDKNNNEVQDQGENNLSGWDMNLYRGSDCLSGNYLRDLDTNSSGNANFGSLVTGDYSIKETLKSGWKNTTQLCQNVTVTKNTTSTVNFGNYRLGSITIKKDTDPDQNSGSRDYFNYSGSFSGNFYHGDTDTFRNLPIGQYTITEAAKSGWVLTNINCSDNTGVTKDIVNRTVTIELTADKNITCTFKNLKLGRIEGYKFNDINANGVKNSGENKLSGWTITLDKNRDGSIEATTVTDVNGNYKFDNLTPGWYRVCEVPQTDWHSTLFGGAICRDTEIHNNGGDVDEIIFANRKLGSINVCKVITDTEGNVVNGSEVLGSTFTIDWNMGLIDTIFTSNYTPNTDLFSDVTGNDAYCVLYDNLPIDSYRYSQESISGGPSVWQIPLYNDQYKTTVNSLNDFYSYGQNTDSNGEINLALDAGVHRTLVILNQYKFGSISGQKFNDLNGNGQKDEGEVGIENWVINLDKAADGLIDATAVTDANGNYLFDKLTPGSYRLREVNQNGWNQTTSDPDDININAGDKISGVDFGNVQFGSVNVTKFNDANGNGQYDDGETVLSGWDINLSSTTKTTGENGQVLFDGLNPDTYYLSENIKNGWKQTNIYCEDSGPGVLITQPGEAYGHHGMCEGWNNCGDAATCALWACEVNGYDQLVSYGEDRPCTQFDNCHLFNYRGSVQYNWGNWCGVRGVTDIKCSNRSINVTPTVTPTSALTPTPTSYEIGWNNILGVKVANAQEIPEETGYKINLSAGQNAKCYIGNQLILPTATISKTNNVTSDLKPGDSVEYKINLNILDNDVTGFNVTDLLSNGFKYRAGSYKVTKNGLPYSITEPEYHSPGVWNLGDLKAGDKLELTYIADISTDQQAGTYFDLAYAKGQAAYGDKGPVIALNNSDQFVGTQVPVVKSNQNSISAGVERTEIISGQVLGASTEMPSTGAATIWLAISGLLGIAGFSLLKISKKTMLTILFTLLSFGLLVNPVKIQAADLSIKLEIPKSPTNFKEVDLKFVVLDISGAPITAKCFKKGPSDSAFSQFGSDIVLVNGGNSASCVLSSVINDSGSYQFYATANSVASNTVTLDYKNSTPDTPYDYRKEKINNCDYKIHFKTGNDSGKTVKVEVYRADITNFILDDGSKIAGINIGSDQEYDLTNSVPNCNKEYYYVLRAFDDAGNGSGTVGDRVTVKTITENTTTNTTGSVSGAIPLIGSNNIPKEGEIKEGNDSSLDSQSGSILGTEKTNPKSFITQFRSYINNHKFFSILIAISLLAIINYGVKKVRGKRK